MCLLCYGSNRCRQSQSKPNSYQCGHLKCNKHFKEIFYRTSILNKMKRNETEHIWDLIEFQSTIQNTNKILLNFNALQQRTWRTKKKQKKDSFVGYHVLHCHNQKKKKMRIIQTLAYACYNDDGNYCHHHHRFDNINVIKLPLSDQPNVRPHWPKYILAWPKWYVNAGDNSYTKAKTNTSLSPFLHSSSCFIFQISYRKTKKKHKIYIRFLYYLHSCLQFYSIWFNLKKKKKILKFILGTVFFL